MRAKEILFKNVIGVNQAKLNSHHDFLPSVLKAMEEYTKENSSTILSEKEIEDEAAKRYENEGRIKPFYFLTGAKWVLDQIKKKS